ncbi:Aste57867_17451 [Aphanomyces stellatus]|uniref:Aste57867_17451 protein n=1 Tax=Aphanomyces stellatus TaxID=120398 RepID=A0A485L8K1_9STRA|nr:hypothetical protein As57867_017391 [Aphanomyces stellatus]VFT94205.1 Aste57867_17451 [Aphanomyces stellatus]
MPSKIPAAGLPRHGSIILDISAAMSYGTKATPASDLCFSDYYYALIFPNTPHELSDVADERISFAQAKTIIRRVTCGAEAKKESAVAEFAQAWVDKFRSVPPIDIDTIPVGYFRELMRNIVIQRLGSIPGLTLVTFTSTIQKPKPSMAAPKDATTSIHVDKDDTKQPLAGDPSPTSNDAQKTNDADDDDSDAAYIYCLIRISRELLMEQADKQDVHVPIWPEVDPGSEYWETHSSETSFTLDQADRELNRMFLEGQIQADEACIFDGESAAMVSRRIHAIQRIADTTIRLYFHPSSHLHFPFRNNPAYHYLYRHIDSCQMNMPFRLVDKIRVTKTLLDGEFNYDMLRQEGFLVHHMCIHTRDPSDEDDTTLDMLADQWGSLAAYWNIWDARRTGNNVLHVLYYQPIATIRDYFGEQLALYFAFLSYYAEKMVPLVLLGLAAPFLKLLMTDFTYRTTLAVFNCGYAARLLRKWTVHQQWYACEWGQEEVKFDNSVRAEYAGHMRISPINNAPEIYALPSLQYAKKMQSIGLFWLGVGVNGAIIFGIFALQAHIEATYVHIGGLALYSNVVIAFIINLSQTPFHAVVVYLNDWENHRTVNKYDVALTVKFTIFQTLNYFGPVLFSMFLKPYVFGCNKTTFPNLDADACTVETTGLLLVVLVFNFVLSIRDVSIPLYHTLLHVYRSRYRRHPYASTLQPATSFEPATFDSEVELTAYEGVLFDYAQIAITFGYVTWFASASPQAPIIAFAITVVQIRVDAYKLCFLTQRPYPIAVATVGGWAIYFEMICLGGILVNAANVMVNTMLADQAHMILRDVPTNNWLGHLFSLTILLAVLYALSLAMRLYDSEDREKRHHMKSVQKRQEYLRNVYLYQLSETSTSQGTSKARARPAGDIYLNGVYRYIVSGDVEDGDQVDELREELQSLERAIATERPDDAETIGLLKLVVASANILPVMDRSTKALDAFVKVKLKLGDKVLSAKHKTNVKRKQRSPVWNAAFEFKIVSLDTCLQLEVMDWNLVGKSEYVGTASLPIARVLPTQVEFDAAAIEDVCEMVNVDVPVELAEGLLESMAKDIPKFGMPVISVNMGIQLNHFGILHLRHFNRKLRVQEILKEMQTYLVWKKDT